MEKNKYPENPFMEIYVKPAVIIKYIDFNNISGRFFYEEWKKN
jgi:hypothetical protein